MNLRISSRAEFQIKNVWNKYLIQLAWQELVTELLSKVFVEIALMFFSCVHYSQQDVMLKILALFEVAQFIVHKINIF